jgi:DNA-binding NarL/FixJ family response regulator
VLELFVPHRVVVPDFRVSSSLVPRWPSERREPSGPRYRIRPRKLTPEQEATIRDLAATKSLRALAAEYDVSHETIRAVVRHERAVRGCVLSANTSGM